MVAGYQADASGLSQPALDASPTPVLVLNADGEIVLVNRELEQQFGYRREELVGRRVDLLLHGMPEAITGTTGDGEEPSAGQSLDLSRQLYGYRKDGSRIAVEMTLSRVEVLDGMLVVASIGTIIERPLPDSADGLAFERFLAELSFRFINITGDQLTQAIQNALTQACVQFELDRSSFFRIDVEGVVSRPLVANAPSSPASDGPGSPTPQVCPWTFSRIAARESVMFATRDDIPSDADRAGYASLGTKSAVFLPLSAGERVAGAVGFEAMAVERQWPEQILERLGMFQSVLEQVLARQQRDDEFRTASLEVQRLKDQLQVENVYLRREERERLGLTSVVGQSAAIKRVLEQVNQVAMTDSTVLLLGETGTGKELFATQIHETGARRSRAMVRVNCAAIPGTLIESELFGREKGAFTGALARQIGRFELADHSTIFLDEIGDLPIEVQVKLLRVLEERKIERLGNPRSIGIDTRIIAATHRNLEQRVSEGSFREDLYYRLNVFPIHVPPLRQRVEDIPLLVWRFVEEFSKTFGKRIDTIDRENLIALQQYAWPGNIRELRNAVERAMIVATGRRLTIATPATPAATTRRSPRLADVERDHIRGVLESTGWRIRGAGGAADRLGLKPTTLETRMAKLGLRRPGHV